MERSLSMELVRVTEAAALSSARWMGRGKKDEADGAATSAMRDVFDTIPMKGTVVIGEGEMDEAPMLYIGEKLGTGYGPRVDVAVDPLEGTNIVAAGGWNALLLLQLQIMVICYMLLTCTWIKSRLAQKQLGRSILMRLLSITYVQLRKRKQRY